MGNKKRKVGRRCVVDGCGMEVRSGKASYCEKHYGRLRRNGTLERIRPRPQQPPQILFSGKPTNDLAWTIGVLWSDGCLSQNGFISVKAVDQEMISQVAEIWKIKERVRTIQTGFRDAYETGFSNRTIVGRLRNMGMHERKSLTVRWPVGLSEDRAWPFVRGVFDGDGCVHLAKSHPGSAVPSLRWCICTASEGFKDDLNAWLVKNSIRTCVTVRRKPGNPLYNIVVVHQESLRRLYKLLYPRHGIPCLQRKREKFETWLSTPRRKAGNPRPPRGESHMKAKLTEHQVKQIRAETGNSQRTLARKYGVAQTSIGRILRRDTWSHV